MKPSVSTRKRRFSDVETHDITPKTQHSKHFHISDTQKEAFTKKFPLYASTLKYTSNLLESPQHEPLSNVKAPKSTSQQPLLKFNIITADSLCKYFHQGNIKVPITDEILSWKETTVFGLMGLALVPILNKTQIYVTDTIIYNPSAIQFVDTYAEYLSKVAAAGITGTAQLAYKRLKHQLQKKKTRDEYLKRIELQLPDSLIELKRTCADLYSKLCSSVNVTCKEREPDVCRTKYIDEIHERFNRNIRKYRDIPNEIINDIFKRYDIQSSIFEDRINTIIENWMTFVREIDGVADEAGIVLSVLFERGSKMALQKFSKVLNTYLEELYHNSPKKYELFITSCFVAILYSPDERHVKFFQDVVFPQKSMEMAYKQEIVLLQENIWKKIDNALALADSIDETVRRRPSFNEILEELTQTDLR